MEVEKKTPNDNILKKLQSHHFWHCSLMIKINNMYCRNKAQKN